MISRKKELFKKQMDEECDANISDDNADSYCRSDNSVSVSLSKLNENSRYMNKLTDLKTYQVSIEQINLN